MRLFCHLCRRLAFRDTCGRCRKVIDSHYEQMMAKARALQAANYLVVTSVSDPQWEFQMREAKRRRLN